MLEDAFEQIGGADELARWALAKERWGSEMDLIDDTGGYGATVIDQCALAGIHLYPVNFSGSADDPRYYNKRAEMHFRAAEWVKRGGALPNVPGLIREACATTYWFHNGQFRVIEKEQVKSELGASPDYWDAFCCTFAVVDLPARTLPDGTPLPSFLQQGKVVTEYDPFAEVA